MCASWQVTDYKAVVTVQCSMHLSIWIWVRDTPEQFWLDTPYYYIAVLVQSKLATGSIPRQCLPISGIRHHQHMATIYGGWGHLLLRPKPKVTNINLVRPILTDWQTQSATNRLLVIILCKGILLQHFFGVAVTADIAGQDQLSNFHPAQNSGNSNLPLTPRRRLRALPFPWTPLCCRWIGAYGVQ